LQLFAASTVKKDKDKEKKGEFSLPFLQSKIIGRKKTVSIDFLVLSYLANSSFCQLIILSTSHFVN
jgi:hypothetical protein